MATIFTRIIQGDIPSYKIAETDTHFAFLDINPIAEGHTLVVPKEETDYLFDLSDENLSETIILSKKIAHAIDKALNPLRTGVIVEGLEVPHAHIHLVPIYREDQNVSLRNKVDVSKEKMEVLAKSIADEVRL
ncbi:HIT family protein [Rhodohalobacter sulfatireducens]|uniref:HIT family protein n=1 Tax=Rhodohalobacter sulfatireducens TaxID=2911366 RepID=A0ABS9KA46_9BACT|nr:HIT family protein [Rhodohalobacter sulfatireducens]MCG2587724.1 HIT family protein [Rhodohalobacter sulfatireducens]